MKLTIISVGRKSSPEIVRLCSEYEKRLSASYQIEWQFIEPTKGKMTRTEQSARESEKVLSGISNSDFVVLLDETGKQIDNQKLAIEFGKWQGLGKNLVFVIGGAYGVSDDLKNRADYIWALSELVFPHEIARLVLIEQLYRTQSIIDGLPYHHS